MAGRLEKCSFNAYRSTVEGQEIEANAVCRWNQVSALDDRVIDALRSVNHAVFKEYCHTRPVVKPNGEVFLVAEETICQVRDGENGETRWDYHELPTRPRIISGKLDAGKRELLAFAQDLGSAHWLVNSCYTGTLNPESNCPVWQTARSLRSLREELNQAFKDFREAYRRDGGPGEVGLLSVFIDYARNEETGLMHPHLHFIFYCSGMAYRGLMRYMNRRFGQRFNFGGKIESWERALNYHTKGFWGALDSLASNDPQGLAILTNVLQKVKLYTVYKPVLDWRRGSPPEVCAPGGWCTDNLDRSGSISQLGADAESGRFAAPGAQVQLRADRLTSSQPLGG
jgi:hypothetical protein